jgi:hypothetical protein
MYSEKFRISILLSIILITVGCTTTKGPLFQNDNPRMNIRLSDYSVIFNDRRQNTENRKLFVPITSYPWQQDKISPKFNKELEDIFHLVIAEYQLPGPQNITFEVSILEGYQEFIANAFSETEVVSWKISIRILDKDNGELLCSSEGQCWGRRTSIDASPEMVRAMYYHSFAKAVTNAFEKLCLKKCYVSSSLINCYRETKQIESPPHTIFKVGYEFTPLNESGWIWTNPEDEYNVDLVKQGLTPNSTYAIQIWSINIPSFHKNESFYDFAKSEFEMQRKDSRFILKEKFAKEYKNDKSVCVEIYFRAIDNNPVKREKYAGSMILENRGYICQHPEKKDTGYTINLSRRYHKNREKNITAKELQKVFTNFTFTDIN